ncbi:hypothetical protein [Bifidobacterium eulemuris]|uniref:Phage protein Gp19/Gp15/Gp42 n=1 Tax=Bifidobacterium eulemuris TaxID=1765219 RepID=A0A261GA39_9BIFI|nr:hypothetical protein [Bifidobacterium eulemuris]OZG68274.1 hypothetical protein BEUL_1287 [Bifidobacterium eulemuris]QOL31671.1 hypothetical protein BE0216_03740 [Bifidobacterium eulemuris]
MAANIENIDWLKHMRVAALVEPELFDERLPTEWVLRECRLAAALAVSECPAASVRLRAGRLTEDEFAGVVCDMVMRVARWHRMKTESNGSYSYTEHDPQSNTPGYDPSPRLFISKGERALLNGYSGSSGRIGTISMGFDTGFGG